MHRQAEYGVAAHWRYKEAGKPARAQGAFDEKIAWLRAAAGVARRGRRLGQDHQAGAPRRHRLRADAAGQGDRPAGGRDAGRLRLRAAHRPRPPLPRRAGRRPDGAARHARSRAASASRSSPRRPAGRRATGCNAERGFVTHHRARHKIRQWFNAKALAETVATGRARGREGAEARSAPARRTWKSWRRGSASRSRTICSPPWRATRSTCGSCRSIAKLAEVGTSHRKEEENRLDQGQRADRGHGQPDDAARALLQAGAARPDPRLRHARQGRLGAPRGLRQPEAAGREATRSG